MGKKTKSMKQKFKGAVVKLLVVAQVGCIGCIAYSY